MGGNVQEYEFERALSEIQQPLKNFVRSLVQSSASAEDVIQETNLAIWNKRNQFACGTNFTAWAFRIARFKALSHHRDLGREKLRFFGPEMEEMLSLQAGKVADELPERLEALRDLMDDLDESERELLFARYEPGRTVKQFARTAGVTESSAHQAISRLRRRLREELRARLDQTDDVI